MINFGIDALVTRLCTSQDASMMDILCVDKTGTITSNKLSVADITALDGYTERDVVLYGALASSEANQDPIDTAFIAAAKQKGLGTGGYVQISFTPFDPSSRKTESIVQNNDERVKVTKGVVMSWQLYAAMMPKEFPFWRKKWGNMLKRVTGH